MCLRRERPTSTGPSRGRDPFHVKRKFFCVQAPTSWTVTKFEAAKNAQMYPCTPFLRAANRGDSFFCARVLRKATVCFVPGYGVSTVVWRQRARAPDPTVRFT